MAIEEAKADPQGRGDMIADVAIAKVSVVVVRATQEKIGFYHELVQAQEEYAVIC